MRETLTSGENIIQTVLTKQDRFYCHAHGCFLYLDF